MACTHACRSPALVDPLTFQSGCLRQTNSHCKALVRFLHSGRSSKSFDKNTCWKPCTRAASDNKASTSTSGSPPPTKRYVRRPRVSAPSGDPNLKTYSVQDENVVVEGVARIDRGEETLGVGRTALLVAGDTAALLVFALAGKVSHSGTADFGVLQTAAPFLIGWFTCASLLGAYSPAVTVAGPQEAAVASGKAWAIGIPVGIAIRGVLKGQVPPTPFIVVTLVSTLVLLVGWRAALAAATGTKAGGDRSGNPLEFLELLSSLVRRWEL